MKASKIDSKNLIRMRTAGGKCTFFSYFTRMCISFIASDDLNLESEASYQKPHIYASSRKTQIVK